MKVIILSTILLTVNSLTLYSQNMGDTTKVSKLLKEGVKLLKSSHFQESQKKLDSAKTLSIELELHNKAFEIDGYLVESLWRQGKLVESLAMANFTLQKIKTTLGNEPFTESKIYLQIGTINILKSKYDSALYFYGKVIDLNKKTGVKGYKILASVYANSAYIYGLQGDFQNESDYYEKALEIDKQQYGNDHIEVAIDFMNIGNIYRRKSLFNISEDYFLKSLSIIRNSENRGETYITLLNSLGAVYILMSEYNKAEEYLQEALKLSKDLFGDSHPITASTYSNLGHCYLETELYDTALFFMKKNKEILKNTESKRKLFKNTISLSLTHLKLQNTIKSLSLINKAIQFAEKNRSSGSENLLLAYSTMGRIQFELDNIDKSEYYFNKYLAICDSLGLEEIKSRYWYAYKFLSRIYNAKGEYETAIKFLQKGIAALHVDWTPTGLYDLPSIKGIQSNENYLEALTIKIELLNNYYTSNKSPKTLNELLNTYDEISTLSNYLESSPTFYRDKFATQESIAELLKNASLLTMNEFLEKNENEFLVKSYQYFELSKSKVLKGIINSKNASKLAGIPRDILNKQEKNKFQLSKYQTLLYQQESETKKEVIKGKKEIYKSKIFEANLLIDSLNQIMEDNYPIYHKIKYKNNILSLDEVRSKAKENEAFLEYFINDTINFVFYITKDHYKVKQLPNSDSLQFFIQSFREKIEEKGDHHDMGSLSNISNRLYEILIDPIEKELREDVIKKLTIIPERELGYLPFEVLLTQKIENSSQKREYPYLIKKYEISYAYSISLLYNDKTFTNKKENQYISYAPSYPTEDVSKIRTSLNKFRNAFSPLLWNQNEAISLDDHFSGKAHIGKSATEKSFKENAAQSEILHLAMHAFIDDDDPMNSKMVFYQDNDSIEDGYLHTFELLNLNLNAQLAVLSACQTGYGKIVKGEGIMSLARGFSYAGVPSIVMSHWRVDDESTFQLMTNFYKYLADGKTKSSALRLAKIDYLNTGSPNKIHPFFWSPFVLIGDDTPITQEFEWWWVIFGIPSIIITLIILRTKAWKGLKFILINNQN